MCKTSELEEIVKIPEGISINEQKEKDHS
jgi:hypothetical protein